MRSTLITLILCISLIDVARAGPEIDRVWEYLAVEENSAQWAVISVEGSKGYLQCERDDDYLRCPFPVWAKLRPDAELYRHVASQDSPFPEVGGTVDKIYMNDRQAQSLISLLSEEELEFAEIYGLLEDEDGDVAGTAYDVVMVLELDYNEFARLVERFFRQVWSENETASYLIETDR